MRSRDSKQRSPLRRPVLGVTWMAVLAVLLGGVAGAAEEGAQSSESELRRKLDAAQERLDAAAREVADLSQALSEEVVPRAMALAGLRSQRAMLGVNIGSPRDGERDDGVEVVSVSPGGPSAAAGLQAGDVLIEVNGTSLKRQGDESPRRKLLGVMRDVEPGEAVTVKYRRDGQVRTAEVVPEALGGRAFNFTLPGTVARHLAFMRADGVFGTAELVSLTPELGRYFGTDEGLLVVRAPADARLKLQDGDVIVDIDGRVPASPGHALRILGSYQAGEKMKLNVLRMKKRMSFEITIPEDPVRDDRWEGMMEPSQPMPPPMMGPPHPPAPPAPGTRVRVERAPESV